MHRTFAPKTLLLVGALALVGPGLVKTTLAADIDCVTGFTTLEQVANCTVAHMPGKGSNKYAVPLAAALADFRSAVTNMLADAQTGSCTTSTRALPLSLRGVYEVRPFTDNGKNYCILREKMDFDGDGIVDRGWGTFITNLASLRPWMNHAAPHPLFDATTEAQAIKIFKDHDAGTYLMCGAHREANGAGGGACDTNFGPADCAHQDNTMFHAAVQAMNAFFTSGNLVHLQWHGNASCSVGAFGSHGFITMPPPGSSILTLKNNMAVNQPGVSFQVPPSTLCDLNATDNVQGRYLNGAATVCSSNAGGTTTGKFVHIEQLMSARNPLLWIPSVSQTWQAPLQVTPTALNWGTVPFSANPGTGPTLSVTVKNVGSVSLALSNPTDAPVGNGQFWLKQSSSCFQQYQKINVPIPPGATCQYTYVAAVNELSAHPGDVVTGQSAMKGVYTTNGAQASVPVSMRFVVGN